MRAILGHSRCPPLSWFWWIVEKPLQKVLPFPVLFAGFGTKLQAQTNTHTPLHLITHILVIPSGPSRGVIPSRFIFWKALLVKELMAKEFKTFREKRVRRRKVRNELEKTLIMVFMFRKEPNLRTYWIKSILEHIISTPVEVWTCSAKLGSNSATWVSLGMHSPKGGSTTSRNIP